MANDGEISAAVVREYFLKNGGKVKRDDLFDHFRGQLDKFGDQGGSKNRFGDIVNSLASLQNIEGEKYFVLKKSRNGTTPVMLRRPVRQANQRKEKGVSLPATMKSFRFSAAEDAFGNLTIPDKARPVALTRVRTGYRSESSGNDFRASRNNSDTTENGLAQDSGLDTSVSSLPSESPRGSRQSSFSRTSEYDQMSQNSGDTGFFNEEDPFELEIPSYVLTPFEKSWMMSAIAGNKSAIICQLEENPKIVSFKDFIMGYSALHWAAKQGNEELVRLLIDAGAEVNMKSNGGYTPLHLAALHGKVNIIHILVDIYHADLRIRDHSGKEAKDLVSKNSSEEIKQKLQDPRAVDGFSNSGLRRSVDQNGTPRIQSRRKKGLSFRSLKKTNKWRKGDRPVIEHWDSTGQQRLQSTLDVDEKKLEKMQRNNSGSLFPVSFYSAKGSGQAESKQQGDAVDGGSELDHGSSEKAEQQQQQQRESLMSRSYPESEFRNLRKISESEAHESFVDQRRSSASIVRPTTASFVEPQQNIVDTMLTYGTEPSHLAPTYDANKRRSYSDNSLSRHVESFPDELATRLTLDRDPRSSQLDEDVLELRINSNSKNPSVGNGLATSMTVPDKSFGTTSRENDNLKKFAQEPWEKSSAHPKPADVEDEKPLLSYGDEYSTTLTFPNRKEYREEKPEAARQHEGPQGRRLVAETQNKGHFDEGTRFILGEKTNSTLRTDHPQVNQVTSADPVRPPRKKDKTRNRSLSSDERSYEKTSRDFDSPSAYPERKRASVASSTEPMYKHVFHDFSTDRGVGFAERRRMSAPAQELPRGVGNEFSAYPNFNDKDEHFPRGGQGSYTSRGNHMPDEMRNYGNLAGTSMWRSEGYVDDQHEQTSLPRYTSLEYPPGKPGYLNSQQVKDEDRAFHEHLITNPRKESYDFTRFPDLNEPPRMHLSPDQEPTRRRSDGFARVREVSLDHPQFPRWKSEGFIPRQELSLDHPSRRTVQDPPAYYSPPRPRDEGRRISHEVVMDSPHGSTTSGHSQDSIIPAGYTRNLQDGLNKDAEVNRRVPPPYRPPPSLTETLEAQGQHADSQAGHRYSPSSLSCPLPPPTSLGSPSLTNPSNLSASSLSPASSLGDQNSVSTEAYSPPTEYRFNSPALTPEVYPSSTTPSPVPPPRRHRGSLRRTSDKYLPPTSQPTYTPFSSPPSGESPRQKSFEYDNYESRREVSLDHPKQHSGYLGPVDDVITPVSGYFPSALSNYQNSEHNEHYPKYPSQYAGSGGDYSPQSSLSTFEPSSEVSSATRSPVSLRRSGVDTKPRDQSPSADVVARSYDEPYERRTYPSDELRNSRREIDEYNLRQNGSYGEEKSFETARRQGDFGRTEDVRHRDEVPGDFEGHFSSSQPNSPSDVEPEFIVAKQLPSDVEVTRSPSVPRDTRMDLRSPQGNHLNEDMKGRWRSTSSDVSNESSDSKNKYRMTSVI